MINTQMPERHTFLTATEVMARYRWKRTKGYQTLQSTAFPKPIAGRYRLDTLMAWEDTQLADAPASTTPVEPLTDEIATIPPRRRSRSASPKAGF